MRDKVGAEQLQQVNHCTTQTGGSECGPEGQRSAPSGSRRAATGVRNNRRVCSETVEDHDRRFWYRWPLTWRSSHAFTVLNTTQFHVRRLGADLARRSLLPAGTSRGYVQIERTRRASARRLERPHVHEMDPEPCTSQLTVPQPALRAVACGGHLGPPQSRPSPRLARFATSVRTEGWSEPRVASVIARARSSWALAPLRSPKACSTLPRLPRSVATSGWSEP
jgi:hypothetical protein